MEVSMFKKVGLIFVLFFSLSLEAKENDIDVINFLDEAIGKNIKIYKNNSKMLIVLNNSIEEKLDLSLYIEKEEIKNIDNKFVHKILSKPFPNVNLDLYKIVKYDKKYLKYFIENKIQSINKTYYKLKTQNEEDFFEIEFFILKEEKSIKLFKRTRMEEKIIFEKNRY